jgi:hypothetical protein
LVLDLEFSFVNLLTCTFSHVINNEMVSRQKFHE